VGVEVAVAAQRCRGEGDLPAVAGEALAQRLLLFPLGRLGALQRLGVDPSVEGVDDERTEIDRFERLDPVE
jgi:hypothetical protein